MTSSPTMIRIPSRQPAASGFTFIEVLMALGIFIVGSVGIVALFAQGVDSQVRRRLDSKAVQVRPEVDTIVQEAIDKARPGAAPALIKDKPLSVRGFSLDVLWRPDPWHGTTMIAYPTLLFNGRRHEALPPIVVTRSTLDPSMLVDSPGGGGGN